MRRYNQRSLDLNEVLKNFKMEKPKKTVFGNYRIENDSLIYKTVTTEEFTVNKENFERFKKVNEGKKIYKAHIDEELDLSFIENYLKQEGHRWGLRVKVQGPDFDEIARKIVRDGKTSFIGNSNILSLIGRTVAYGNVSLNRSQTEIQRIMENDSEFFLIPFNVFIQAKLDLNKFELIEKGHEETLKINKKEAKCIDGKYQDVVTVENRHFTGASLFKVDGKCYLFDVDRRELKHKIFNPFLATIKGQPKTIKEAYESLKPKAVVDAEKLGKKVLRQGEWFFIETKAPKIKKLSEMEKMILMSTGRFGVNTELAKILKLDVKKLNKKAAALLKFVPRPQQLKAGNSRPNTVEMIYIDGKNTFCSGVVKHTGREHADLKLDGWFLAVPNTSIENFTVTGEID